MEDGASDARLRVKGEEQVSSSVGKYSDRGSWSESESTCGWSRWSSTFSRAVAGAVQRERKGVDLVREGEKEARG